MIDLWLAYDRMREREREAEQYRQHKAAFAQQGGSIGTRLANLFRRPAVVSTKTILERDGSLNIQLIDTGVCTAQKN